MVKFSLLNSHKEGKIINTLRNNDGTSYDIFSNVFRYFLCIWRQIRSLLYELSMIWVTFCIVFSYSVGVLSLFSEKSCKSEKQDIKWSIEDWRSMILKRYLNTMQSEENSFQVPKHYKTEERSKNGRKLQNSHPGYCLIRPCTRQGV